MRYRAVICESVLAMVPDKPKAMHEYLRVTKAGAYVGLNESTPSGPPLLRQREKNVRVRRRQSCHSKKVHTCGGTSRDVSRASALFPYTSHL